MQGLSGGLDCEAGYGCDHVTKSWGVLIPVSSQVAFRVIWVLGGRYSVPCALQFYGLSVVMEEINIAGFVERITFSYANMLL